MNFQCIRKIKKIVFSFTIYIILAGLFDSVVWAQQNGSLKVSKKVSNAKEVLKPLELSLEEAIQRALRANRSILNADNNLKIKKLALDQERAAFDFKLFPGGAAGVTGSDSNNDAIWGINGKVAKKFQNGVQGALTPGVESFDDNYTASVGVSLTIPLLRGRGRAVNLNAIDALTYSVKMAQYAIHASRVNIILSTVAAVYDIIKQEKLLGILKQQAKRFRGHINILKIKEKTGIISSLDVYRAEIRLKDIEDNYARSLKILAGVKDQLKILLGAPVETSISVQAPLTIDPVRMKPKEAVQTALKNRYELRQARADINEAARKVEIAEHNLLPEINIAFDYNRMGSYEDYSGAYPLDENRWNIRLISTTDWSRKAEKIAFRQRFLELKKARIDLASKTEEIKKEVREQLDALNEFDERIRLKKKQIHQASGKQALAEIKFRHGLADNSDFIEAETELRQARANKITAEIDYIVGAYRLRAALGTLLEHQWSEKR